MRKSEQSQNPEAENRYADNAEAADFDGSTKRIIRAPVLLLPGFATVQIYARTSITCADIRA